MWARLREFRFRTLNLVGLGNLSPVADHCHSSSRLELRGRWFGWYVVVVEVLGLADEFPVAPPVVILPVSPLFVPWCGYPGFSLLAAISN